MSHSALWTNRPPWKTFTFQVGHLLRANLKSRYRKTWAGFFWVVFNPLMMFGVQSYIFSHVLKMNMPNYSMFLLSGLLPWLYLVQSLEMATPMFVVSGQLLKSFPAHPLVYLLAQLLDNFINFMAAFLILFCVVAFSGTASLYTFLLPIPLLLLMTFIFAISWFLSTNHVFFRDTRYIVKFVLNISFFMTPIFYNVEMIPEQFRWMATFNPFYILIRPFRTVMYSFDWNQFVTGTLQALLVTAAAVGLALLYWRKKKNEFYFNV
jgi:lipopolysaccharide transport system permease protein